jgi:hypothetical protein
VFDFFKAQISSILIRNLRLGEKSSIFAIFLNKTLAKIWPQFAKKSRWPSHPNPDASRGGEPSRKFPRIRRSRTGSRFDESVFFRTTLNRGQLYKLTETDESDFTDNTEPRSTLKGYN